MFFSAAKTKHRCLLAPYHRAIAVSAGAPRQPGHRQRIPRFTAQEWRNPLEQTRFELSVLRAKMSLLMSLETKERLLYRGGVVSSSFFTDVLLPTINVCRLAGLLLLSDVDAIAAT